MTGDQLGGFPVGLPQVPPVVEARCISEVAPMCLAPQQLSLPEFQSAQLGHLSLCVSMYLRAPSSLVFPHGLSPWKLNSFQGVSGPLNVPKTKLPDLPKHSFTSRDFFSESQSETQPRFKVGGTMKVCDCWAGGSLGTTFGF